MNLKILLQLFVVQKKHAKELFRIMRLTTILLFVGVFQLLAINNNTTRAQNITINIDANVLSVGQLLDQIEHQSDYLVVFRNKEVDTNRSVTFHKRSGKIETYLDEAFKGTDITYSIDNKYILLYKKSEKKESAPIMQQAGKRVTGTITDKNGEPIIGANIVEKGTTNGTVSDLNGKFSIYFENGKKAVLLISYIGYQQREIVVTGNAPLNITLSEDTETLDEVVVVGYGIVRKSDLTGSVSSVKNKELTAIPSGTVLQALQGRSAGTQIKQNNGAPGSSISVRIRGTNSIQGNNEPLYVIDGFPISGSPSNLNNSEIESVEILKDASATAIYGSRGANGVVLITTKQGKSGKTNVDFETSYSSQSLIKKLDLMNATEYAQLCNIQQLNNTGKEYFTQDEINSFGEGFDWQDLIFQKAPLWKGSLSINGGNEKTKFALSGSIWSQDGIIKGSTYRRYSLQTNLQHKISRLFSVDLSSVLTRSESDSKDSSGGARGSSLISAAISAPPTLTPYAEDGSYRVLSTAYPFLATDLINPLNFINESNSHYKSNSVLANISFLITPISDLTIKIMGGIENSDGLSGYYKTREYIHSTGYASLSSGQFTSLLNENTATYNKKFGKNNISAVMGFTFQNFLNTSVSGSGTGFLSDSFEEYKLQTASSPGIPSSGYTKSVLKSYLARVNYNFDDKYLVTASIRRDGSSRYSKGNKWGNFPSAAFAWRASNEGFMKDNSLVSNLKVRASWGLTGSQAIDPYVTLNTLSNGNTVFGDALYTAFSPGTRLPGNLKWETTEQYNLGIDLGLKSLLNVTIDYYVKNTRDLLNSVLLPTSSGYINTIQNIGKVQNKGLELTFDYHPFTGRLKWDINANIAFNRNKVKKLYNGDDVLGGTVNAIIVNDVTNILREGRPIGQFWGYLEEGYDDKGQIIFKDINEDGVINKEDKTYIGDPNPDFIYGITSNISWKNFEFNVFLQGSQGNDLFNASAIPNTMDYGFGLNMPKDVLYDHWTPENTNAKYPAINYNTKVLVSNRFIENGSYLRLKNIQLAYNIPVQNLHLNWINNLQIYASGQNLLTFTK